MQPATMRPAASLPTESLASSWVSDAPTDYEFNSRPQMIVFIASTREGVSWAGELRVRVGDLGAVKVRLSGRDLGTPGPSGQVATFVLTPESTAFARS